jgi:hypothetical protein
MRRRRAGFRGRRRVREAIEIRRHPPVDERQHLAALLVHAQQPQSPGEGGRLQPLQQLMHERRAHRA